MRVGCPGAGVEFNPIGTVRFAIRSSVGAEPGSGRDGLGFPGTEAAGADGFDHRTGMGLPARQSISRATRAASASGRGRMRM